jgi:spore maturation protein CgeB
MSSSSPNGHATPWRSLLKALHARGHQVTFFERDVPYYAAHRDLPSPEYCDLVLYSDWSSVLPIARRTLADADVAIVTSYCPDGLAACREVLAQSPALRVFYDLDTPVTLSGVDYLEPHLVPEFDLYLSFTGGPILEELRDRWGARRTAALYGSVDPDVHAPVSDPPSSYRCALGYLGTYAADRQPSLDKLLIQPARKRASDQFMVVGSLYPPEIDWPANVRTAWHLDPREHPAFYSANRVTLSVTRQAMLEWGFTPSGRIFEAMSCSTPVLSDPWPGLETFFEPGVDILVARGPHDVESALDLQDDELRRIGRTAREKTLARHTGAARAKELVSYCEAAAC